MISESDMNEVTRLQKMGLTRLRTVTTKLPAPKSGLQAAIFVHVDWDQESGEIQSVEISNKHKDDPVLERVFDAISGAVTEALRG